MRNLPFLFANGELPDYHCRGLWAHSSLWHAKLLFTLRNGLDATYLENGKNGDSCVHLIILTILSWQEEKRWKFYHIHLETSKLQLWHPTVLWEVLTNTHPHDASDMKKSQEGTYEKVFIWWNLSLSPLCQ